MINVYIDQLSAADALELFNYISERDYIYSAECNRNAHNSSVRIECYNDKVFGDLAQYHYEQK